MLGAEGKQLAVGSGLSAVGSGLSAVGSGLLAVGCGQLAVGCWLFERRIGHIGLIEALGLKG